MRMNSETTNDGNTVIDVFLTLNASQANELRTQLLKDWRNYQGGIIGCLDASGRNVYMQFQADGSANLGRRVAYSDGLKVFSVTARFFKKTTAQFDIRAESEEEAKKLANELAHEYQYSSKATTKENLTIVVEAKDER